jgi:type IV secretion system protein VirB4
MDQLLADQGPQRFATAWLRHKGLDWAAALAEEFSLSTEKSP